MNLTDMIRKEPIREGWSVDMKYCVTDQEQTKYLLRITPLNKAGNKENEFDAMRKLKELHIPMCELIQSGTCDEGVYSLQSWIEGKDAESILPLLPESRTYAYGLEAGRILKKIHSIPAPASLEDWETRFNRKIDRKIKMYQDCPVKCENGDAFVTYINENRSLLANRPQCYQHGDYHIGNMMIDHSGQLTIIDFDRSDYGDPWEEFNRIVWCAQVSPLFASGMVNGYFDDQVPLEFWKLLALYISSNTLSSVPWAVPFGEQQLNVMLKQTQEVLSWYNNMTNPVPSWYTKGYYLQYIDGLPYKLKSPYNFDFIHQYGTVFKIYDDQDSGNICFGVQKDDKRYFIKFAGAPTEQYNGTAEDTISRLKATLPVYQSLTHPNLIQFLGAKEIGGGYAMFFEWADGECMGRMYPEAHQKFMKMDLQTKQKVFLDILNFFQYIASNGYTAIDFYDGSILYDFDTNTTTICDIDYFQKVPFHNNMGRMWGSSRFQSPEEYKLGAVIDEITNVYTLGATAFALFSDCDRSEETWPLSKASYTVVKRAISDDRIDRQGSIQQLTKEWLTAIQN